MPGLAITPFARFFAVFLDSAGIVGLLLASGYNKRRGIVGEEYPATLLFALAGMGAACAASDLLMLFLGLEAFTFAFYLLVAIERDSVRGGEAGLKYLLNGTLSAAVLAMGIALVYCSRGTLRLSELARQPAALEPLFLAGVCLILLGVAFKLSLVPAHLWTPDVYQGAPAPVTALLSTASKGASVAAVVLILPLMAGWRGGHDILWCLALATMVCGNLAALVQTSIKRLLAWSSVAQMGYVALAFVALPAGGGRAAIFYSWPMRRPGWARSARCPFCRMDRIGTLSSSTAAWGTAIRWPGRSWPWRCSPWPGFPRRQVSWPSLRSSAPRCGRVKPPWPWRRPHGPGGGILLSAGGGRALHEARRRSGSGGPAAYGVRGNGPGHPDPGNGCFWGSTLPRCSICWRGSWDEKPAIDGKRPPEDRTAFFASAEEARSAEKHPGIQKEVQPAEVAPQGDVPEVVPLGQTGKG